MTRLLQVLSTVTLLCPSLCKDHCQEDTTSLVQIKSFVNPGNRRFNDRDVHSEEWDSEMEGGPMMDDNSMIADDPRAFKSAYHDAERLGSTLIGPNGPAHTAHKPFALAKKRRMARKPAFQRPTYGLKDNYAGRHATASLTNALDSGGLQEDEPSDFLTHMVSQGSPAGAFSRSKATSEEAVSDSSVRPSMDITSMASPEDQAFVANEVAKSEALIHKRAADAQAYQDKVQAEEKAFEKRMALQKALADSQKNAETNYLADQKAQQAQIAAYLMKQQSAYNAYAQAQQLVAGEYPHPMDEIAQGEAFGHTRAADAKAYQDKVQAEEKAFEKGLASQKALADSQKSADTKYFADQKAKTNAYLLKQQSAYNAYAKAQLQGAAKVMKAQRSVEMAMDA